MIVEILALVATTAVLLLAFWDGEDAWQVFIDPSNEAFLTAVVTGAAVLTLPLGSVVHAVIYEKLSGSRIAAMDQGRIDPRPGLSPPELGS